MCVVSNVGKQWGMDQAWGLKQQTYDGMLSPPPMPFPQVAIPNAINPYTVDPQIAAQMLEALAILKKIDAAVGARDCKVEDDMKDKYIKLLEERVEAGRKFAAAVINQPGATDGK